MKKTKKLLKLISLQRKRKEDKLGKSLKYPEGKHDLDGFGYN